MPGLLLGLGPPPSELSGVDPASWWFAATREEALHFLATRPQSVIVIGPGAERPFETAQILHRAHREAPLVFVGDETLRRQLRLTPLLGSDVIYRPSAEGLGQVVSRVAARSSRRASVASLGRASQTVLESSFNERTRPRELLVTLLESLPVGVALLDRERVVLSLNAAAERILARAPNEVLGRRLGEFVSPQDVQALDEQLGQHPRNCGMPPLIRVETPAGLRHVELSSTPVSRPTGGCLVIVHDVSERHFAQVEAARLETAVVRAKKTEALGLLAGGVAHDFNNFLTAILGNAELARRAAGGEPVVEGSISKLIDAAQRAADLTQQLLAYVGDRKVDRRRLDLAAAVREMQAVLRAAVQGRAHLELELESCAEVEVNPVALQQLILNLVMNAADALGGQSGAIRIRTHPRLVTGDGVWEVALGAPPSPGRYAELSVADEGCGIAPEDLDRVFDPFFTTKEKGHGIGLAAAVGFVDAVGGCAQVRSELGQGTQFVFLLPVAETPRPSAARSEGRTGWSNLELSGKVVLVDDLEGPRLVAGLILKSVGLEVQAFGDGQEAVDYVREHPAEVDLVLLDLSMPGLNGVDVLHLVREIRPGLPAILSSGFADDADLEGFDAFVPKPYRALDLVNAVQSLLPEGNA